MMSSQVKRKMPMAAVTTKLFYYHLSGYSQGDFYGKTALLSQVRTKTDSSWGQIFNFHGWLFETSVAFSSGVPWRAVSGSFCHFLRKTARVNIRYGVILQAAILNGLKHEGSAEKYGANRCLLLCDNLRDKPQIK